MRQLLAFTRKELRLWAQKPGAWVIVFIVPFLFIWIMQAVFGSSGTPVFSVYAVAEDQSEEAERILDALRDSSSLQIEELETRAEADRRVGAGERMAAVVVPDGFAQSLQSTFGARVEIIIDPARAEQASIVSGLVSAALAPIMVDAEVNYRVETSVNRVLRNFEADPAGGASLDTLQTFLTAALKAVVSNQVQEAMQNPRVQLSVQSYAGPEAAVQRPSLLNYLVPGYSLMFAFFLVANLAVTVVEERQSGTLRRLLVMPVPRSRILLGKMLPYYLIAAAQMTLVLTVSSLAFGIDLGDSSLGLAIVILTSSLAMASLGILVAAFARSETQADGLAIVLVLAMAVISGAMFPNISIPGLQAVTPHYWALQGFLNVMARGQGVEGTFLPAGILLTMSAVFFTAGAIRFWFE